MCYGFSFACMLYTYTRMDGVVYYGARMLITNMLAHITDQISMDNTYMHEWCFLASWHVARQATFKDLRLTYHWYSHDKEDRMTCDMLCLKVFLKVVSHI